MATAAVTTITATAVGFAGTMNAYQSEVERFDKVLSKVAADAKAPESDQITAAIESASDRSFAVQVSVLDTEGRLINLYGVEPIIVDAPPASSAKAAIAEPTTVEGELTYRMKSLAIDSGDYILLIMPLQDAIDARTANFFALGGFVLLAVGMAILLIWVLIRFDLRVMERLIDSARRIAAGEKVSIPKQKRGGEVAELSSALNQMIESLRQSIETEKSVHKAMQSFMGDASHELRTPLTVIKGYSELLVGQGENLEFRAKALTRVLSEVDRMEQLINDLLLLAELGEQKRSERHSINLTEIVSEFVDDLKTLQPTREIAVKLAKSIKVVGSGEQLNQLLSNLFANLRKHTPADAQVQVTLGSSGENMVVLTVEDAGPGLAEKFYEEGVDSFMRFDAFASRQTGSSGLGMTIMRTIVGQHGGKIKLSKSSLGGLKTEIYLARK